MPDNAAKNTSVWRLARVRRSLLAVLGLTIAAWVLLVPSPPAALALERGPAEIAVVPIVTSMNAGDEEVLEFAERFLRGRGEDGSTQRIEAWLTAEATRAVGATWAPARLRDRDPIVDETLDSPGEALLPPGATAPSSVLGRWAAALEYAAHYERLRARLAPNSAVIVFLHIHDIHDRRFRPLGPHPFAIPERGIAVVSVPASDVTSGHSEAIIAHEILHLFGARDRHAGETEAIGPATRADIMTLAFPAKAGEAKTVTSLDECDLAPATAAEIGWTPEAHAIRRRAWRNPK